MDLIRDIEDSEGELVIRGEQGSGPVLFYTGLTGIVAGVGFAFIDEIFGQIVVLLSALVVVTGYVLAQRQTTLEVDHDEDVVSTKNNRWSLQDVAAVAISPYRRVPSYIDDASLVTEDTGTQLWRAWVFADSDLRERNKIQSKLDELREEGSELHVMELIDRLEGLGGEVFMQMPTPENPTEAAARAARHIGAPFFDFALEAAPRRLDAGEIQVHELRDTASERNGLPQ
ncbi:MAG: hypothetical protein ACQEVA_19110 [Myxococcota bacterium]